MKHFWSPVLVVLCFTLVSHAQLDRIVIPAGTPEDLALQEISKETDGQKKLSLYHDFLQKFSSNPAAWPTAIGKFPSPTRLPATCRKRSSLGIWHLQLRPAISISLLPRRPLRNK